MQFCIHIVSIREVIDEIFDLRKLFFQFFQIDILQWDSAYSLSEFLPTDLFYQMYVPTDSFQVLWLFPILQYLFMSDGISELFIIIRHDQKPEAYLLTMQRIGFLIQHIQIPQMGYHMFCS